MVHDIFDIKQKYIMFYDNFGSKGSKIKIDTVLNYIKEGYYLNTVEDAREERLSNGKTEKYNSIKGKLPLVNWQGVFSKRGKDNLIESSNLVFVDIDHYDESIFLDIHEVKIRLINQFKNSIVACWDSVSGKGLGMLILSRFENNNEYNNIFNSISKEVNKYGIFTDKNVKSLNSLNYISSDFNIYINKNEIKEYEIIDDNKTVKNYEYNDNVVFDKEKYIKFVNKFIKYLDKNENIEFNHLNYLNYVKISFAIGILYLNEQDEGCQMLLEINKRLYKHIDNNKRLDYDGVERHLRYFYDKALTLSSYEKVKSLSMFMRLLDSEYGFFIDYLKLDKYNNKVNETIVIDKYLDDAYDELITKLKKNKRLFIEAPTGCGKTQTTLRIVNKYISENKSVLWLTPFAGLTLQTYRSCDNKNKILLIGNNKVYNEDIEQGLCVFTTFSYFSISNLKSVEFDLIIIDEVHTMVTSYSKDFMFDNINSILTKLRKYDKEAIFLTGTPVEFQEKILKSNKIVVEQKNQQKFNISFAPIDYSTFGKKDLSSVIDYIFLLYEYVSLNIFKNRSRKYYKFLYNRSSKIFVQKERKLIIPYTLIVNCCNISALEFMKDKICERALIESYNGKFKQGYLSGTLNQNTIEVLTSSEKHRSDVYKSITSKSIIPFNIKILLVTSLIESGININNKNILQMIYVDTDNITNIASIKQFFNRVRNQDTINGMFFFRINRLNSTSIFGERSLIDLINNALTRANIQKDLAPKSNRIESVLLEHSLNTYDRELLRIGNGGKAFINHNACLHAAYSRKSNSQTIYDIIEDLRSDNRYSINTFIEKRKTQSESLHKEFLQGRERERDYKKIVKNIFNEDICFFYDVLSMMPCFDRSKINLIFKECNGRVVSDISNEYRSKLEDVKRIIILARLNSDKFLSRIEEFMKAGIDRKFSIIFNISNFHKNNTNYRTVKMQLGLYFFYKSKLKNIETKFYDARNILFYTKAFLAIDYGNQNDNFMSLKDHYDKYCRGVDRDLLLEYKDFKLVLTSWFIIKYKAFRTPEGVVARMRIEKIKPFEWDSEVDSIIERKQVFVDHENKEEDLRSFVKQIVLP